MDAIIAIIWVVFMIIATVKAIVKKKKQQDQARVSPAASKPVYTAREENVRSFLEEIGVEPAEQPQRPAPEQPQTVVQAQPAQLSPPPPLPPAKTLKSAPSRFVWDDEKEDTSKVSELSAENDPVAVLAGRLSPIQRAVIWREILDTPPGLRAGVPAGE